MYADFGNNKYYKYKNKSLVSVLGDQSLADV